MDGLLPKCPSIDSPWRNLHLGLWVRSKVALNRQRHLLSSPQISDSKDSSCKRLKANLNKSTQSNANHLHIHQFPDKTWRKPIPVKSNFRPITFKGPNGAKVWKRTRLQVSPDPKGWIIRLISRHSRRPINRITFSNGHCKCPQLKCHWRFSCHVTLFVDATGTPQVPQWGLTF